MHDEEAVGVFSRLEGIRLNPFCLRKIELKHLDSNVIRVRRLRGIKGSHRVMYGRMPEVQNYMFDEITSFACSPVNGRYALALRDTQGLLWVGPPFQHFSLQTLRAIRARYEGCDRNHLEEGYIDHSGSFVSEKSIETQLREVFGKKANK